MATFSTPAIVIRRLDYGDHDLIITLLSAHHGKLTAIAKAAKRSKKRFGGILELFYRLEAVIRQGKRGLPILMEASLQKAMFNIAADIHKTAYANYWAELIHSVSEENARQPELFTLLMYVLEALDAKTASADVLSVLFQMRFLTLSGICPNIEQCSCCETDLNLSAGDRLNVDLEKGGWVCETCSAYGRDTACLAKGTVKQLQWINHTDLRTAVRLRFSQTALKESLGFLESFVGYHMGKDLRSLKFLRQIRRDQRS